MKAQRKTFFCILACMVCIFSLYACDDDDQNTPTDPPIASNITVKFVLDSTAETIITNENITSVGFERENGTDCYQIVLQLDSESSKRFAEITTEHIGETISVIVTEDGQDAIINQPTINEPVTNSRAIISGFGSLSDASEFYKRLTGVYPS